MNNWCICWFFMHMLKKCTVQEAKSPVNPPYIHIFRLSVKGRYLCVIPDLQMKLHSAATWLYQVFVLFITLINIIYVDKQFSNIRAVHNSESVIKKIGDTTVL